MVDISIKRSCPVNLWNQAKENSKGKDRMSVELNHYLEITRSHVHQIYRELETSGKIITVDLVRKLFYGVDEDNKTLLQVFPGAPVSVRTFPHIMAGFGGYE